MLRSHAIQAICSDLFLWSLFLTSLRNWPVDGAQIAQKYTHSCAPLLERPDDRLGRYHSSLVPFSSIFAEEYPESKQLER